MASELPFPFSLTARRPKNEMRVNTSRIRDLWRRVKSTRYARALEAELGRIHAENCRLRDENRALLNSILGIAGIPPVYTNSPAEDPRSLLSPRAGSEAPASGPASPSHAAPVEMGAARGISANSARREKKLTTVAVPLRRRSWHQVNRSLEFEAARKKPQEISEG